jgi:mono/diheme cytochrome c family protein
VIRRAFTPADRAGGHRSWPEFRGSRTAVEWRDFSQLKSCVYDAAGHVLRLAREPAVPVLFVGETGTGRSDAAHLMHHPPRVEIVACAGRVCLESAGIIRILASSDSRTDGALENGTFALESCARTRAEIVRLRPLRARTEDINPPSGNQTRAATLLGLNRDQVRYRIEKSACPATERRRRIMDPMSERPSRSIRFVVIAAVAAGLAVAGAAYARGGASGEEVYAAQKCASCHSVGDKGNKKYPLDGVGGRLSETELREWLVSPDAQQAKKTAARPLMRMPSYRSLPPEDLDVLVTYLKTLK